ncbi:MAG: xanthine dehydrogenase family protein subunit M [Longimicrobiales bacterium]|nr:xanthine dehydrogenase family protein subunit M [Longimicrobiales bacterium]
MSDTMAGFELHQPIDVDDVLELKRRYGTAGWLLAGGLDSLDWFKDRVKTPEAVIDLTDVEALHGVRETDDGIEIGAVTTLTEVERNPVIRRRFRLLAEAAAQVASPQIRHAGTLGGNVCQDTRCWYYRYGVDCYRAGGNTCYAAAPDAQNREHAIFGASRCVAVSPSDTAPALVALDAEMIIRGPEGQRVVAAGDFFMEPSVDIQRMTVLGPDELLVAIRIPSTWAEAHFYFEKVADRNSWDFALASVAAAFRTDRIAVDDVRLVCGSVQCVPRRMEAVERAVRGRVQTPEGVEAAGALATRGAEPLAYNGYKIQLVENLVKRALRSIAA